MNQARFPILNHNNMCLGLQKFLHKCNSNRQHNIDNQPQMICLCQCQLKCMIMKNWILMTSMSTNHRMSLILTRKKLWMSTAPTLQQRTFPQKNVISRSTGPISVRNKQ